MKKFWLKEDAENNKESVSVAHAENADNATTATTAATATTANNALQLNGKADTAFATAAQGVKADTAYQKPQNGIPSTDLSSDVQNALELASTALQSIPDTVALKTDIPTNVSELTNDAGFITNVVNDLVNYYTKSETYTQAEVNALISAIPKFDIEVVATLPTSDISETTVYLVPSSDPTSNNIYTEYIYVNGSWEKLGEQSLDLSGYVTTDTEQTISGKKTFTQEIEVEQSVTSAGETLNATATISGNKITVSAPKCGQQTLEFTLSSNSSLGTYLSMPTGKTGIIATTSDIPDVPDIPEPTTADNDKVLGVVNGEYSLVEQSASGDNSKLYYNLGAYDTYTSNGDGTATITRKTGYVDLSSLSWGVASEGPSCYFASYSGAVGGDCKCGKYKTVTDTVIGSTDKAITYNNNTFVIHDSDISSASDVAGALYGVQAQVELATSYTEQVIENQPLNTLPQDGEQWVREEWEKGLNLFNKDDVIKGYAVSDEDGTIFANADDSASGFIPIKPNTRYIYTPSDAAHRWFAFYDSNKQYISGLSGDDAVDFVSPSNVAYVRLTVPISNLDTTMLVKGSHSYPYQPYHGEIVRTGTDETITGIKTFNNLQANDGMEIYGATPYIDFHYGNDSSDYTARLINNSDGQIQCVGSFDVVGTLRENQVRVYSPNNPPDLHITSKVSASNIDGGSSPSFTLSSGSYSYSLLVFIGKESNSTSSPYTSATVLPASAFSSSSRQVGIYRDGASMVINVSRSSNTISISKNSTYYCNYLWVYEVYVS